MVVNFGHVVFAQIRQLVGNVNNKNSKATSAEIQQLLELYGHDVYAFLFRSLINQLDLQNPKAVADPTRLQLLAQELGTVMTHSNYVSIICEAFEALPLTEDFCATLSKTLKFSATQQLTFAVALAQSTQSSVQQHGIKMIKSWLSDAEGPGKQVENQGGPLEGMPTHVLSNMLLLLNTHASFDSSHRQTMLKAARRLHSEESCSIDLMPLLYASPGNADALDIVVELPISSLVSTNPAGSATQLSDCLYDMGYGACCSVEVMKEILGDGHDVDELSVAHVLCMMARTAVSGIDNTRAPLPPALSVPPDESEAPRQWNVPVLIESLAAVAPNLNWRKILSLLDQPTFRVDGPDGLKLILSSFTLGHQGETFPVEVFLSKWQNTAGQLSVIKVLLCGDAQLQQLLNTAKRRTRVEGVATHAAWASIDLIESLLRLSDAEGFAAVRPLLNAPLAECPQLLLCGLAHCSPSWGPMYDHLLSLLLRPALTNATDMPLVRNVWEINKGLVVQGMVMLASDASGVSDVSSHQNAGIARCFQVAQELGGLLEVLSMRHTWHFVIPLAMYAGSQEAIPFANWAAKSAEEGGSAFAVAALSVLRGGAAVENSAALLQALQAQEGSFDPATSADIQLFISGGVGGTTGGASSREGDTGASFATPAAPGGADMGVSGTGVDAMSGQGSSAGAEGTQGGAPANAQQLFAHDIEEEANSHFQRIYTSEIQIEAVVEMLKAFKTSTQQREQEVFACMIHNLFDEYRFFPRYPERELLITGKLFGSLIQHQLVSSITLGIALRYVLEALRKPFRSNMFRFGMCALEEFKSRLVEWPQYCHHMLQIAHIRHSHVELIEYIQNALQGRPMLPEVGGSSGAGAGMSAGSVASTSGSEPQPVRGQQSEQQQPQQQTGLQEGPQAAAQPAGPQTSAGPSTAYPSFGKPPGAGNGSGAMAGFSQGFGQEAPQQQDVQQQPPPVLERNSSSDLAAVRGEGGTKPLDMNTSAAQQALSVVSGSSAFGASTNVDTLMAKQAAVLAPDTAIQDKVHFVYNNLSATNLEAKERDLMAALPEQFVPWLCQYTVIKRAAQEQNYLSLYIQFMERLDKRLPALIKGIVTVTIDNIKLLLLDEKLTASSSVRSLLKNLGSWLGMLTLQRNQPILQRQLDVRKLLLEAYQGGRLVAVVPFVAKILETVQNSRIFRPPNPWTIMILAFLAEIHPMTDLKLNIKFECEVLCKALNTDLKEIKPSALCKGIKVTKEGNPDWNSRADNGGLSALKPLPTVPDARLMAVAAGMAAQGALGSGSGTSYGSATSRASAAATSSFGQDSDHAMPSSMAPTPPAPAPVDEAMQNLNIQSYIVVSPHLALFHQFPHLVPIVVHAVNQAIKDIVAPVVERSVTIASITTRELMFKDFALEQDDALIKGKAHLMVSNLASSLALVTSKEPLRHNVSIQVRQCLTKVKVEDRTVAMSGIQIDERIIEEATIVIASENLELGCNVIEKAASERAVREIDGHLEMALAGRRKPGSRFHDEWMQAQQLMVLLPELLRPKTGAALQQQARVYDEFARLPRERLAAQAAAAAAAAPPGQHPQGGATPADKALRAFEGGGGGGLPPAAMPAAATAPQQAGGYPMQSGQPADAMRVAMDKCMSCLAKAEEIVMRNPQLAGSVLSALPQGHQLQQALMLSLSTVQQAGNRQDQVAMAYAQRVFARIFDSSKFGRSPLGVDFLCATLTLLMQAEGGKRLPKELLGWLLLEGDFKANRDLTCALVQHRLLSLNAPEYVSTMAKAMDLGRGGAAVETVVWVVHHCLIDKRCVTTGDCSALLDALAKVAQHLQRKAPEHLVKLLDMARALARSGGGGVGVAGKGGVPVANKGNNEAADSAAFKEQVTSALDTWTAQIQTNDDRAVLQCMTRIIQQGWLKGDELTNRFFRLLVTVAIERCLIALASADGSGVMAGSKTAAYTHSDSVSKLIRFLVTYHDEWARAASGLPPTTLTRQTLLNKFLAQLVRVMHAVQAARTTAFDQKPFHHLLLCILSDLYDVVGEDMVLQMADVLVAVQPRMVPAFTFSWLELVSHRALMPKLLQMPRKRGWAALERLLVGLFRYLYPHLRAAHLPEAIQVLYKGTLRTLLVLLHDFPEFLCEYHMAFCDVIPPQAIQLRNLILSAFPRSMTLPDALMSGAMRACAPGQGELSKPPTVLSSLTAPLTSHPRYPNLKSDLDAFLRGAGGRDGSQSNARDAFLKELPNALMQSDAALVRASGSRYNAPLINALVLYVAAATITAQADGAHGGGACLQLLLSLCRLLDEEGRYLLLNAMANQLRYPNSHTYFVSGMMLQLFAADQDSDTVRETMTRVLIERLIAQKPHPWGLLVTVIELLKNPSYGLWKHKFVRATKEIDQLMQSVAEMVEGAGNRAESANATAPPPS